MAGIEDDNEWYVLFLQIRFDTCVTFLIFVCVFSEQGDRFGNCALRRMLRHGHLLHMQGEASTGKFESRSLAGAYPRIQLAGSRQQNLHPA